MLKEDDAGAQSLLLTAVTVAQENVSLMEVSRSTYVGYPR